MVGITKLLCGNENFGDKLRYVHGAGEQKYGVSEGYGPVVVWNCTRSCNLKCVHCYSSSENKKYEGELTTKEAKAFIGGLGEFKVPVILFSGGEPLIREDLFELVEHACKYNIRSTISTNGTLISRNIAMKLKQTGMGYVGISLDGIGSKHDEFRGVKGSFNKALDGIRNCLETGQKVGLRFTINRHTYDQLGDIFRLVKEERIPRVCFYHLVYSGRGSGMVEEDVTHQESRAAVELIMEKSMELGPTVEVLTVDNHADAVYLFLWAQKNHSQLADHIWKLIKMNGGNRSGMAFGNVDFQGNVHPDQFTQQYTFGNVKERAFGEIWRDTSNPISAGLKNRKPLLKGRCSQCKWLNVCNGNFRSRAEVVTGDFWASDPACYLTNEEIGLSQDVGLV